MMKRTSFFLGLGLVGLHRTIQLQLSQHEWFGHRLDYGTEWFALERNRDHSVIFEFVFWTLLLTMRAIPFLLRDSCLSVVDVMVI